jgi:IclR family mhp operon transcriptional activator
LAVDCNVARTTVHQANSKEQLISTFGSVRSLQRGLAILQAVNRHNGLRASEIAKLAGVPRPTAYRLLETLEGLGFVLRGPSEDNWRPTLQTKSLSSGFRDEDWVAQIAVPQMMKLGRQLLWPLDLVTFRDFRMEVRESTHNISPYSIDHGMVGRGLPVLETAGGRAFLAYLPEDDRQHLLKGLRAELGDENVLYQQDGPLDFILKRARELGLGYRIRGFNSRTMSLSAPIMSHDRPIACLTMIWIASALKFDDAVKTYGDALKATADSIAEELARLTLENSAS